MRSSAPLTCEDVAVEVGDADADGGALEDRAEAGLAGVQRLARPRPAALRAAREIASCSASVRSRSAWAKPAAMACCSRARAGPQVLLAEPSAAAVEHQVGVDAVRGCG